MATVVELALVEYLLKGYKRKKKYKGHLNFKSTTHSISVYLPLME